MLKLKGSGKGEKGFTLIELLVVAAIIGILLAIAIPNLLKARISANEANARKMMQTLRDAEGEYFEQDLNNDGTRDYTNLIGTLATGGTLRCPSKDSGKNTGGCDDTQALIDKSFEGANDGQGSTSVGTTCKAPKAGYCDTWDTTVVVDSTGTYSDFGWQSSMSSFEKTGRKDFSVYGDGAIRCTLDTQTTSGQPGKYAAVRATGGCE